MADKIDMQKHQRQVDELTAYIQCSERDLFLSSLRLLRRWTNRQGWRVVWWPRFGKMAVDIRLWVGSQRVSPDSPSYQRLAEEWRSLPDHRVYGACFHIVDQDGAIHPVGAIERGAIGKILGGLSFFYRILMI